MTIRNLTWIAVLGMVLFGNAVTPSRGAEPEDARVAQAREELQTSKEVLAEVTNEAERVIWQQHVTLAEKELANAERLVRVEEHEKAFASQRRVTMDYALREALATIDTAMTDAERLVQERNADIRRLKAQRTQLESMPESGAQETDEALKARADMATHIRNLDAEILARALERDARELKLRVVRDAGRIETFLRELHPNPRPTIQLLVQKKQGLAGARKIREEYDLLYETDKVQQEETATAIRLTQERFGQLDENIAILQDRFRVEKQTRVAKDQQGEKYNRQIRLRRMLNTSKSEKLLIEQRIKHLQAQYDALCETLALATQGRNLLEAEIAFLQYDLDALKSRYFHVVLVPAAIVLAIVVIYFLVSRLVFPLFVSHENLFVSRRLGSYVVLLLIIAVLVSFFLEDLKAIATVMGIVGAAIVIALQDLCSSFAGWFVIVASRKITVGDRVEIDGRRGDVVDIQMLRITLLELNNWLGVDEPTGRVLIIPNSFIFKSAVFNFTYVHPYVWNKVDVTVTFETPPQEARDLLLHVLKEETADQFAAAVQGEQKMAKKYGLSQTVVEPHLHTVIADSGVCYSLFYVAHYKSLSATRDKVSARILKEFEKDQRMQFAYPTQRHIPTAERGGFAVTLTKEGAGR
ncbi:MAG: mechanosensitive ion channel domain-containing protein [Verrucomicrobiota bacterium]